MLRHIVTLFCAACILSLPLRAVAATTPAVDKEIVMFVGEIKSIPASKVTRIAIGNGSLISTRFIDDNQMLLIAEAIGDKFNYTELMRAR